MALTALKTRYVVGLQTSQNTPVTIRYLHPPHRRYTRSMSWSCTDDSHPFRTMSIGPTIPELLLFLTLTLKLQGQDHGCGQRAQSCSLHSIYLIYFLFASFPSNQQLLEYIYIFWNLSLQNPRSRSCVRSKSHSSSSILPMHVLFVSRQLGLTIPEI